MEGIFSLLFLSILSIVLGRPQTDVYQALLQQRLLNALRGFYPSPFAARALAPSHISLDPSWPSGDVTVGQVGGLAIDPEGNVYVFHRGDRKWEYDTFSPDNVYQKQRENGWITAPTLLKISPSGQLLGTEGRNRFFMPHGLSRDTEGNLWVTDVALHQVLKLSPNGSEVLLTLGEPFVPGTDDNHFCKPTDTAVASNGDFFVSDGYCNGRIMKFSKDGRLLHKWGRQSYVPSQEDDFLIPHSLALSEKDDVICVADREHGRVQCFNAGLTNSSLTGQFVRSYSPQGVAKAYAIDIDANGENIYVVSGPGGGAYLYQVDTKTGDVNDRATVPGGFGMLHDVVVSRNGRNVYTGEINPARLAKFNVGPVQTLETTF